MNSRCPYCGGSIHTGLCPMISSVIYHANGAVEYVMWKYTRPPVIGPSFSADGKAGTAVYADPAGDAQV